MVLGSYGDDSASSSAETAVEHEERPPPPSPKLKKVTEDEMDEKSDHQQQTHSYQHHHHYHHHHLHYELDQQMTSKASKLSMDIEASEASDALKMLENNNDVLGSCHSAMLTSRCCQPSSHVSASSSPPPPSPSSSSPPSPPSPLSQSNHSIPSTFTTSSPFNNVICQRKLSEIAESMNMVVAEEVITPATPSISPVLRHRFREREAEVEDDHQNEKIRLVEPLQPTSSSTSFAFFSRLSNLSNTASLILVIILHLILFSVALMSLNSLSALLATAGVDARVVMITNNHKPLVMSSSHGGSGMMSAHGPLPIALLQSSIIRSGKLWVGVDLNFD